MINNKKLTIKQLLLTVISIAFVTIQVWLDLKIPDYMNEITKLLQTPETTIKDVLNPEYHMILCTLRSLLLFCPCVRFSFDKSSNKNSFGYYFFEYSLILRRNNYIIGL